MEFSLDHLQITSEIANDITHVPARRSSTQTKSSFQSEVQTNSSAVLEDLSSQIEDLQNKLKLNYRKLLLFETENEKLIQEKNKLYFDVKNTQEKFEILSDKNESLEAYSQDIESKYKSSHEKYLAFEKLCETQSIDLKRLSKFHLKIKDIIKPYVQSLKTQIEQLTADLHKAQTMSSSFEQLNSENILQVQYLKQNIDQQKNKFETEKSNFIQSYEEQIHFLSKEIIQYQQKNEILQSEVFKLKKMNENKNFLENELIKFKRSQEDDQIIITDLKLKLNQFENTTNLIKFENSESKNKISALESESHRLSQSLESTRAQLNTKIDELEKMHLRLKMLEKLNTNLSQNFTNQNSAELQTKS